MFVAFLFADIEDAAPRLALCRSNTLLVACLTLTIAGCTGTSSPAEDDTPKRDASLGDTPDSGSAGGNAGQSGRGGTDGGGFAGSGGAADAVGGTGGSGATSDAGAATAGGDASAGPAGTECTADTDCVVSNDCYAATCSRGSCVGSQVPRGDECAMGFCNGFGRCLPCLDDASDTDWDTGCGQASPMCLETDAEPLCVGCVADADCDDDVECSFDRCRESVCENVPFPEGTTCSDGVCNGEATDGSCALCIDDASGGLDTGCSSDQPICDLSVNPPVCSLCEQAVDCDDGNECTSDRCILGACENATIGNGTPCSEGYCNGIPGGEICITRRCLSAADCNDGADCTEDVCNDSSLCVYTPDHGQCPVSDDVCLPNLCTVGTGCQQLDTRRTSELLANGHLDDGNTSWEEVSVNYSQVIFTYGYVPTLQPHSFPYVAWLGGGEGLLDEYNSLSQIVDVPTGTVDLDLSFFYQVWPEDGLADSSNSLQVVLRATDSSETEELVGTLYNQDDTRVWTRFNATLDATNWAGASAVLELSGTGVDGYTHFFVDSISLIATRCE